MTLIGDRARAIIAATLLTGDTFPRKATPPPVATDCRTAALRTLRTYICDLTFLREGAVGGPPVRFKILPENFIVDAAPYEQDVVMPRVYFVPGKATHDTIGLTSYLEEDTIDRYAPGTVLQWQAEYRETVQMEIWCATPPERHAICAGLDAAFMPTEQSSCLRLRVDEYFGEIASFVANGRMLVDDADAGRHRWRVRYEVILRINIVALVNYATLQPVFTVLVDVEDPDVGAVPVVLDGGS